jgi:hypothetical protein
MSVRILSQSSKRRLYRGRRIKYKAPRIPFHKCGHDNGTVALWANTGTDFKLISFWNFVCNSISMLIAADSYSAPNVACKWLGCLLRIQARIEANQTGFSCYEDNTVPSSVTVKAFTTSHLSTLTCFGHHRPSSEGTSILSETTITVYALTFKIYIHTIFVKHTLNDIQTCYNYSSCLWCIRVFKTFC